MTSAHKYSPKLLHQYKDSITTDSNDWYTIDIIEIIKEEITAVRDLIDIEPDSKCKLLIMIMMNAKQYIINEILI